MLCTFDYLLNFIYASAIWHKFLFQPEVFSTPSHLCFFSSHLFFFSVNWTVVFLSATKWWRWDLLLEVMQRHRTLVITSSYRIRKTTLAVCAGWIALRRNLKWIEFSCIAIVTIHVLHNDGQKEVVAVGMWRKMLMEKAAGMENSSAGMDYIGNDNFVF